MYWVSNCTRFALSTLKGIGKRITERLWKLIIESYNVLLKSEQSKIGSESQTSFGLA